LIDWSEIRSRFPALAGRTYLNSATIGQMPIAGSDAVREHLLRRDRLAGADLVSWFDDLDSLRGKIGSLIHASADDIAFVPSTSHALSILLHGIAWKAGDRVLTLEDEFPNNSYAPAMLKRLGVELIEAPRDRFGEMLEMAGGRVRLVLASAMSYLDGYRFPWESVREILDRNRTLLFVDGTQGCGVLHMDVQRMRPDVLAVHAYKWMLSPTGAGFVYVKPEVRQWLEPTVVGWRSHHSWRDFGNLHHGMPEWSPTAERYEACMQPVALLAAMEASVDLFLEIGPEAIEARALELAARVKEAVERVGGSVAHPGSPIAACKFPGVEAAEIAQRLAERNVLTSARKGNLRVSLHLYNNEEDIERLMDAAGVSYPRGSGQASPAAPK
jgi:cysteine desulfurase / selenocysteine lyase